MIFFADALEIPWLKSEGERPQPMARTRLDLLMKYSAGSPRTQMNRGWSSGKQLFAFKVVRTGAFASSAKLRSS